MKIKSIALVNYRAFLNKDEGEYDRYELLLPSGENLLIYGENGSGKSSLFKGMKDFFASALNPDLPFKHNSFYVPADNPERPYIKLVFEDDTPYLFSMDRAATNTPDSPDIRTANVTKGFIGYRDLLRLHFNSDDGEPDLFNFFLGFSGLFSDSVLLTPGQPANKVSFGELWQKISDTGDQADLDDYNINFIALLQELEGKVNLLVPFFHEKLTIGIEYQDGRIADGQLVKPKILFKVNFYGQAIEFTDFLNEARITSLAISVYLAHMLTLPDTPLKILFLDDIFIGLDNSNRMPLLNILTKANLGDGSTFIRHQLFLTTYDREWFEFAKSYLKEGWIKSEFYVDDHSLTYERPYIKNSSNYREAAWSNFLNFDYPASANYLRKAIESLIRNILPENVLHQGFNANTVEGSQLIVSKNAFKLVEGEDEWYFKSKTAEGAEVQPFRFMGLEALITRFEKLVKAYNIPFENLKNLKIIKDRLLNPLSHDNLQSPVYKNELLTGFAIVDDLKEIRSEVILNMNDGDVVLEAVSQDHLGVTWYYVFELFENLRFIQYKGHQVFINAKCRSAYRQSPFGHTQVDVKDYVSVGKLCEGIFYLSDSPGTKRPRSVTQFMLDNIYNINEHTLRTLI
jgi:hypothetical protein